MATGVLDGSQADTNASDLFAFLEECSNFSLYLNDSICNDTNSTGNVTDGGASPYKLPHPLWLTVFLGTAACLVIIMTVLGNIMVLLSFFIERALRQPTNYFIASLAMSDLLIGTFSMPCFTIYILLDYWPLGEIICDLWLSLDWTVCLASQYTVFFITTDRFCSVKIPAKYRNWRTDMKVRIMIAGSWIIPSLVFFISIIGWQYFVGERTVTAGTCEVQFLQNPLFTFLLTIGYYWLTLIVMIVLYVGIYRVALKLQRKANEKHKKMSHAMELGSDKKAKAKAKTQAAAKPKKESKKRMENNNARHVRGPNDHTTTLTTSFSKNSDADYSKPSEEDRSSSPAFASDEDDSDKKESCYVNSAVQTEPTLKGMLGTSFNHMSRLAFSISGTSVTTSQASSSERDISDDQHRELELDKPLISETKQVYKPIKEDTHKLTDIIDDHENNGNIEEEKSNQPISHFKESDILDGLRYIDEDSLKSLTSAENVRLLAEIMDKPVQPKITEEAESPVWRKRVIEDDKTLLVPISGDSASSEATSSNMTDCSRPSDKPVNHVPNNRPSKPTHKKRRAHRDEKDDSIQTANHTESKSKHKSNTRYGSPLQTLVKSLRPHTRDQQKKIKSKSENRARKALRTISIILGAYVLCWTPYHVMVLIVGICDTSWNCINLRLYYFTYWLCYLNSPINPFCYAFANAQFKRTFLRILKFDFHRT